MIDDDDNNDTKYDEQGAIGERQGEPPQAARWSVLDFCVPIRRASVATSSGHAAALRDPAVVNGDDSIGGDDDVDGGSEPRSGQTGRRSA